MEIVGACGLICSDCSAYKATQANDPAAIARVAEEWAKQFNGEPDAEHVWCDGCMTASDRRCGNCAGCPIRKCVSGRGFSTCAECGDYPCKHSVEFFRMFPEARQKLDEMRAARQ